MGRLGQIGHASVEDGLCCLGGQGESFLFILSSFSEAGGREKEKKKRAKRGGKNSLFSRPVSLSPSKSKQQAPGTAHITVWGTASLLPEKVAALRARTKERLSREKEKKRREKKERREKRKKNEKNEKNEKRAGSSAEGDEEKKKSSSSEGKGDERRQRTKLGPDGDDDDPATSGLRMTLALMSDCLGLPNSETSGAPWPAVRVAVSGTALEPKIGWLGATRDAAALLLPGRRKRSSGGASATAGSEEAGFPGGSGFSSFPGSGPRSHLLPWENHLQRSGGSRREETVGAPPGPTVAGRLERSGGARSKFSSAARREG